MENAKLKETLARYGYWTKERPRVRMIEDGHCGGSCHGDGSCDGDGDD